MEILETGNIVIYLANAGVNAMTANADMVILFSASFLLVGLLGLQSKNVQGSKYLAAAMTSVAITVANFFFIRLVVNDTGYTTLLVAGLGGALGIVSAIYLYDKAAASK
jgi:hypothetical protein